MTFKSFETFLGNVVEFDPPWKVSFILVLVCKVIPAQSLYLRA